MTDCMIIYLHKITRYFLALLVLLLIGTGAVQAKRLVFNAFAPKEVLAGEEFELVYALENALKDAKDVKFEGPKSIDGFKIIAGPVRSEREHYEIKENSKIKEIVVHYSYTLEAKEQGYFKFPTATINVGGEKAKSQELVVRVLSTDDLENEMTFTVKAIPEEIVKGQEFRINYTLENGIGKDFKGPTSIKDMEIFFGPSRSVSTNVQVVNGVTTRNYSEIYSYVVKTDYPAVYKLPVATITVNGKTLTSDQQRVKVLTAKKAEEEVYSNIPSNKSPQNTIFHDFATFVLCCIIPFIFGAIGFVILFIGIYQKKKPLKLAGIVVAVMALQVILIFLFVFAISFFEKVILE